MQLTYKFRLRDTCDSELRRQARAVNQVFNFCNETQKHALKWGKRWPTGYDLQKLTAGSSKELDVHAHTIQQVCQQYERSRKQHRKASLKWRSNKKSLGWVPFNNGHVAYRDGAFVFRGRSYKAWVSRDVQEGQTFGVGSFSQDALGHWYINLPVEVESLDAACGGAVGIDLGLEDLATFSDGRKVEAPRWYRAMQERLAVAQRANKKKRVKAIHARIKNQRADHLHKLSAAVTAQYQTIFVGDVSSAKLVKTRMAKSVLDAGWARFKTQLEYKSIRKQGVFVEVNEAYSTQACSACGSIQGPKGLSGLGIRQWRCLCGVEHDRDVNAAKNIARSGQRALAEGASA
ncbi:MAG: RNA-guided endonuclease InsQ/TnpB family protein [Shewanella sp.]